MGTLRVFATIFVWTFTPYCLKYNGANFIIQMCVNLHINSNIHNEFPAPFVISNEHLYRKIFMADKLTITHAHSTILLVKETLKYNYENVPYFNRYTKESFYVLFFL